MEEKVLPLLCSDTICTGCMACANICPVDAITIVRNEEGFYRPSIIANKCIKCHKCEHICPILNPSVSNDETVCVYAAWHNNDKIRHESTSGGVFSALAETVIANGGIVAGASYTGKAKVGHIIVKNIPDLATLRLSKYVQSNINFIFREIKKQLNTGKEVLFSGTPCQIAGLNNYLCKKYTNLITCDFICHGVPSPTLLDRYISWLEDKFKKNITAINFRDKRKGWYDSLRVILFNDKTEKVLTGKYDSYWVGYNNNNNLQKSCYACKFLGKCRNSDITIADFWGIGKTTPFGYKAEISKGISMIMVNTLTGNDLVHRGSKNMTMIKRNPDEVIAYNQSIIHSCKMPNSRHNFYKDLHTMDYDIFKEKYLKPDGKTKLVKCIREYFPSWFTKAIRLINQK